MSWYSAPTSGGTTVQRIGNSTWQRFRSSVPLPNRDRTSSIISTNSAVSCATSASSAGSSTSESVFDRRPSSSSFGGSVASISEGPAPISRRSSTNPTRDPWYRAISYDGGCPDSMSQSSAGASTGGQDDYDTQCRCFRCDHLVSTGTSEWSSADVEFRAMQSEHEDRAIIESIESVMAHQALSKEAQDTLGLLVKTILIRTDWKDTLESESSAIHPRSLRRVLDDRALSDFVETYSIYLDSKARHQSDDYALTFNQDRSRRNLDLSCSARHDLPSLLSRKLERGNCRAVISRKAQEAKIALSTLTCDERRMQQAKVDILTEEIFTVGRDGADKILESKIQASQLAAMRWNAFGGGGP